MLYWSDKPPVQALFLAAEYQAWQTLSGQTFRSQADQGYPVGVAAGHRR